MGHTREALFAEAHTQEFFTGISIGKRVLRGIGERTFDENHDRAALIKIETDHEINEYWGAIFPDLITPTIVSQMEAVRLGAKLEVEQRAVTSGVGS